MTRLFSLLALCGWRGTLADLPPCEVNVEQPFSVLPTAEMPVAIVPLGNLNPPNHTFPSDHM
jgi:hypothetical protein